MVITDATTSIFVVSIVVILVGVSMVIFSPPLVAEVMFFRSGCNMERRGGMHPAQNARCAGRRKRRRY